MKRDRPEDRLHAAVAAYLRVALRPPTLWTTIGHGGGGRVRGAQLKAAGVQKGWPDIVVIHHDEQGHRVLGIELKRPGGGRQSPEQREVEHAFHMAKCWYVLCRSVEEVENALRYVGIPVRATAMIRARAA